MEVRDPVGKELGVLVDVEPSHYLLAAWELDCDPHLPEPVLSVETAINTYLYVGKGCMEDTIYALAHRGAE